MRVRVHRKDCRKFSGWQIRDLEMNAIDWSEDLILTDVTFYVSQSGRRKIATGEEKLSLHAWAEGEWDGEKSKSNTRSMSEITYNPIRTASFVKRMGNEAIYSVDQLFFNKQGLFTPCV